MGKIMGTIHSTELSGNIVLKLNRSVQSNKEIFEKKSVYLLGMTTFLG